MSIKEKADDLLINIAKLVIGGVILTSIISENVNVLFLFIDGSFHKAKKLKIPDR